MPRELLVATNIRKLYVPRRWLSHGKSVVVAVDGVSLSLEAGKTLALIGESGCGKSTLARCLARLEDLTSGDIWLAGQKISTLNGRALLPARREIQLVPQDAAAALNPRFSAAETVEEPLLIQGWGTKRERRHRALELMEQVQLSPAWADRAALEFSGGQRQRLVIARALALEPKLLIFDESLSGADLSIRAQIVDLLLELQAAGKLTYLFISHDLKLLPYIADEVAIMSNGRIVERGASEDVFANALHPKTRLLVRSVARVPSA